MVNLLNLWIGLETRRKGSSGPKHEQIIIVSHPAQGTKKNTAISWLNGSEGAFVIFAIF